MSSPTSAPRTYRPGDLAPVSGIYRVVHGGSHREPHEALIIRGEQLPACRTCRAIVTFEVVRALSHITHEWDFSGPSALTVTPRARAVANLRRHPRLAVDLPATICFAGDARARRWSARTNDLSEGGIGLSLEGFLPAGDRLRVEIELPEGRGTVAFAARLRHVHGFRHGFEFLRPAPNRLRTLREALDL